MEWMSQLQNVSSVAKKGERYLQKYTTYLYMHITMQTMPKCNTRDNKQTFHIP